MPADADALLQQAREAAAIRQHQTDPAVIALAVERTRAAVERTMWVGISLGLLFTMVTVQQFAAGNAEWWSLPWLAAWLLAPLVEVPLLAILRAEQMLGRYGVTPGRWVRRARWILLCATYAMNTWASWTALADGSGGWRDVLLHSIPPITVLVAAEALTDLREALAEAITKAATVRPPAAARERTRPSPRPREREQTPAPEQPAPSPVPERKAGAGPLGDGRTLRQIGVEWAVENWRDDLRPVDIGAALLAMGVDCSKGERSKIRDAAAAVIAARTTEQAPTTEHEEPVTAGAGS